jgi:hypothetical protein
MKNIKNLFIFTILFFVLGIINIHLSYLGFICMIVPFIFVIRDRRKIWCQKYCPRSYFFTKMCSNDGATPPKNFAKYGKWIMLTYFFINMTNIIYTTILVALGISQPNYTVGLFMIIPIGKLPQIFNFETLVPIMYFSYKIYSMMLSMTILGLILGIFYKPRTWCKICPISTMSDMIIKK